MYILGLNAFHGDAAAALIKDGQLVAAVEEERLNRIKHCAGFPTQSIQYCLRAAGIEIDEVEHVGISRNPASHLHKKILAGARRMMNRRQAAFQSKPAAALAAAVGVRAEARSSNNHDAFLSDGNGNGGRAVSAGRLADRLRNAATVFDLKSELARALEISAKAITARAHRIEHHRAHLASAFFVSPFDRAALLSLDGFGDFVSTMWAIGEGKSIKVLGQVEYPHSLGIVYTATSQFLGFPYYGDEGKVMGLAPCGKPAFIDQFRDMVT